MEKTKPYIFLTVVTVTIACGLGASVFAVVPIIWGSTAHIQMIETWFNTLSYLFSTGVGAIFGMIGASNS